MIHRIKDKIKNNPKLKSRIHSLILVKNQARPRVWVKWFVNPFIHKKGKKSCIRKNTRLDVVPWNKFNIGYETNIEDFTAVNNGVGDVIIGNRTRIGLSNTIIGPTIIGNYVGLGQNVVIAGLNHNYEDVTKPILEQGVTKNLIVIEDNVWIGANSVIVAGVTIGKNSVIAAGSVVTKNIPPFSIAAGTPAKIIKQYNLESNSWEKV
ncbi:acyltransferase [Tenacibaculum sp. C7A-26P2]|uniref:acyltransferase n=1 Tax=Tenacibaculum sp. C7A-26P2 TaxID=3447504 RepID=UPI003F847D47